MMDKNEVEVPELQARVGLQGEVEVLRHMPDMSLQSLHQEGEGGMTEKLKYCECGCGQVVKNRFVSGHNGMGKCLSAKTREKRSLGIKRAWQNKDMRKKHSASLRRSWQNHEIRENRMFGIKRSWKNPEIIKRHLAGSKRSWQNFERRRMQSAATKCAWQDPQIREKRLAGMKRSLQDPKVRKKISDGVNKALQNPEMRKRLSVAAKRLGQYPEVRKRRTAATKRLWQNPEFKAKCSIAIKRSLQTPEARERHLAGMKIRRENYPYWFLGVPFDSNEERQAMILLCEKFNIVPGEGINCHVGVNGKEIDFRPTNKLFIEYHPWDRDGLTSAQYYTQRRKLLDENGFKDCRLIVAKSLDEVRAIPRRRWMDVRESL